MTAPEKDNAAVARGVVGKAETSARRFSASSSQAVKATVHKLPGARRRQVPRCDGCGNPISAGSVLCETCASGTAQMQRVEANLRAANLCRLADGAPLRNGI